MYGGTPRKVKTGSQTIVSLPLVQRTSVPHIHCMDNDLRNRSTKMTNTTDRLPIPGNLEDRKIVLRNAEASMKTLKAEGFVKICGTVAGIHSGSSWMNEETLEIRDMNFRNWNLITNRELA